MRCWHCGTAFRAATDSAAVHCPGCGAKLGTVATPAVLAPPPGPLNVPAAQPWRPSAEPGSAVRNPEPDTGRGGHNHGALVLALLLFGGAGYWFMASRGKVAGWEPTRGEVVGLKNGRFFTRYAKVQFRAADGQRYRFVDSCMWGTHIGESVKILYLPENPNEAKIDSDVNLLGGPVIVASLGCLCLILWCLPLRRGTPGPWQEAA
jgi:hypothetical protein